MNSIASDLSNLFKAITSGTIENQNNIKSNHDTNTNYYDLRGAHITIGAINININNTGAYDKTSSHTKDNRGCSEDYWVEQDKEYNKALGKFYRSNF